MCFSDTLPEHGYERGELYCDWKDKHALTLLFLTFFFSFSQPGVENEKLDANRTERDADEGFEAGGGVNPGTGQTDTAAATVSSKSLAAKIRDRRKALQQQQQQESVVGRMDTNNNCPRGGSNAAKETPVVSVSKIMESSRFVIVEFWTVVEIVPPLT
jgi:hypothetical protein